MKIHIVQKGDTLWELSKKYGVDFEQLKQLNSQLSSPDMIMPGMKIKIPSSSKPVQKEGMIPKETQKPIVQQPYKDTSPKPLPVIKEDDKEMPKPIQPQMPMPPKKEIPVPPQPQPQMPMQPVIQMPIMEQEMQNYTTIKLPQMPMYHEPPKEKPVEKEEPKPMPLPHPVQQPMHTVPLCCHVINPHCPPGPHDFFPVMGTFAGGYAPNAPQYAPMPGPMHHDHMFYPHHMESPEMKMPIKPAHYPEKKDCGCKGNAAYPPHHMGYRMNQPPVFGGFNDYNQQQGYAPQNYPPNFANVPTDGNIYPTPPGFPTFSDYRENEEESNGE